MSGERPRRFPFSDEKPEFDPRRLKPGVYSARPEQLRPFMEWNRDPEQGGRSSPFLSGYMDSFVPEHGLDLAGKTSPHEDEYLEGLGRSMRTVGQQEPATLRESSAPHGAHITEGNHRIAAAQREGMDDVYFTVGADISSADKWMRDFNKHRGPAVPNVRRERH